MKGGIFPLSFLGNIMIGLVKDYIEKRMSLVKLEVTESSANVMSVVIYFLVILGFGLCFLAFLGVGLGLLLGSFLGNYAYGLLIMAGLFLLGGLCAMTAKKSIIEILKNRLISTIFTNEK